MLQEESKEPGEADNQDLQAFSRSMGRILGQGQMFGFLSEYRKHL